MTRKRKAKATAPTPPVEPVEPEPATEAGRMIRKVVNDAIANGAEVITAVEAPPAEPEWLANVRRAKTGNKCPCGEPVTTLIVYGPSVAEAWAANGVCDVHAAADQVHAVASVEKLVAA
jgi:hypothetical protein